MRPLNIHFPDEALSHGSSWKRDWLRPAGQLDARTAIVGHGVLTFVKYRDFATLSPAGHATLSPSRVRSASSTRLGPQPDARSWPNRILIDIPGAVQGGPPDQRGPVGFVNGAGAHALISVATREGMTASYFVSRQLVDLSAPTRVGGD
jgi:hypothetical protein